MTTFYDVIVKVARQVADARSSAATGGSTTTLVDTSRDEPDNYQEWVQPTGAHDAYNTGDKVIFEGHLWESLIDANVWSPAIYPAGWKDLGIYP